MDFARCQSHVAGFQKAGVGPLLFSRLLCLFCTRGDGVIQGPRALFLQSVPTDLFRISRLVHTLSKLHTDRLHGLSLV
jgi:hypothetical protein